MKRFIGGPFNDGCCDAIRQYILSTLGPLPAIQSDELAVTEKDFERMMPRHFPLSTTDDPIPGFPIERKRRSKTCS